MRRQELHEAFGLVRLGWTPMIHPPDMLQRKTRRPLPMSGPWAARWPLREPQHSPGPDGGRLAGAVLFLATIDGPTGLALRAYPAGDSPVPAQTAGPHRTGRASLGGPGRRLTVASPIHENTVRLDRGMIGLGSSWFADFGDASIATGRSEMKARRSVNGFRLV